MSGYVLFDTELGRCGIGWTDAGVVAVQIPEGSDDATRTRLGRGLSSAGVPAGVSLVESVPPPPVARAIDGIVALLSGEPDDLADVVLDLSRVPPFHREAYAVARTIPPGDTMTYGAIASALGRPDRARAVGQAMARNPVPLIVPCHRVVGADGRLVGFSAGDGVATKLRILALEGARVARTPTLFDEAAAAGEVWS